MTEYRTRTRTREIRDFILDNVEHHPKDITAFTSKNFDLTRPAVLWHMRRLINDGLLVVYGTTRDRRYYLKVLADESIWLPITAGLEEHLAWRDHIRPHLGDVAPNALAICQYGFSEMLNNVIDHSEGNSVKLALEMRRTRIRLQVQDDGVGIFHKIQTELGLDDQRHAVLELSKGKLTTDPERHTGEGIFFTSRAFDHFAIASRELYLDHQYDEDWLIESPGEIIQGTAVWMDIDPRSDRSLQEDVFDRYATEEDYGFTRTHVPVSLARYGDENLVSRSQARRMLTRFERFKEVFLDFRGVEFVGQAFADEIFRVYRTQNPHIVLVWVNANEQVEQMIQRALSQ